MILQRICIPTQVLFYNGLMRYVSQLDYADISFPTRTDHPEDPRGPVTTVKTSGCGLCCAVMVADRLLPDSTFDIPDAVALALECGANHNVGTDMMLFYQPFCDKLGLTGSISNDINEVLSCLRTGGCVIANVAVREGYEAAFTKGAHYIVVFAETRDGRFAVMDPSMFKPGKIDNALESGRVETDGKIAYCTHQVLDEDATARYPHKFFLFWRKNG